MWCILLWFKKTIILVYYQRFAFMCSVFYCDIFKHISILQKSCFEYGRCHSRLGVDVDKHSVHAVWTARLWAAALQLGAGSLWFMSLWSRGYSSTKKVLKAKGRAGSGQAPREPSNPLLKGALHPIAQAGTFSEVRLLHESCHYSFEWSDSKRKEWEQHALVLPH